MNTNDTTQAATKLLDSIAQLEELSTYLKQRSIEICELNGCKDGEHNCESYAYVRCDGRLLDVCGSDYFQGCSAPHAAIMLPWDGDGQDLAEELLEQCDVSE